MYILPLDQITASDASRAGAKALRLGELIRSGMNVPAGIVITTDAYRACIELNALKREHDDLLAHLELNGVEFKTRVADFRARLVAQPLPDDLIRDLKVALQEWLPARPMAVRSSALAEDMPENSFAGQYDTFLNQTGLAQILDAVKKCWASLWSDRALSYLATSDVPRDNVAMGVIVQVQVPAIASGVMFTLDPLNGAETEMVIESSWGLGEGVVSGHVTPDHFVVDWLERKIVGKHIADKTMMVPPILPDAQRTTERGTTHGVETAADKRLASSLTDDQVLALASLGERIMAYYGAPQDIEWAIGEGVASSGQPSDYYILQSRPLTGIQARSQDGAWTGANIREEMPGVVSPLSFSLNVQDEWIRAFNQILARTGITEPVLDAHTVYGHAYLRVDKLQAHVAETAGMNKRALDEFLGLEPLCEGDAHIASNDLGTRLRRMPATVKLKSAYDSFWREAEQFRGDFGSIEREFLTVQFDRTGDDDLTNWIRRLKDFHYRANYYRWGTAYLAMRAHADFNPMVKALNHELPAADKPILMANLINVKEIVATARPVLRMWKIARASLASPAVKNAIRETLAPELPARLQSFDEGRALWGEVAAYLAEFSYLSDADEEYSRPRVAQQPALILSVLKQLVAANNLADPAAQMLERLTLQAREQTRAVNHLSRGLLNSLFRQRSFLNQTQILRTYIYWQEETRVLVARVNYLAHWFFGELGRRWAAQGLLEEPEDVFALSGAQLFGLLEKKSTAGEARTAVERWRRVHAAFRNLNAPWTLTQTTPATGVHEKAGDSLTGVACSGGRVTGTMRVINDLAEADKLRAGEILVVPFINPGWMPLLSLAAAVVVEHGGLLSHAAVAARQIGIPTVMNIPRATRLLRDGQRVTVDGTGGKVSIVK